MGKRKKSKFKVRYVFILFIFFLLYEGWKLFTPVNSYRIRWIEKIEEEREYEVMKLMPETLPKSSRLLKSRIETVDWVDNVRCYKSVKGVMTIFIKPRVPVACVSNMSGFGIDKEGVVFRAVNVDTFPKIKLDDDLNEIRVKEAVQLIMLTRNMNMKEIEITSNDLESKIGDVKVIWGNGGYPDKYKILKKVLNNWNISNRKLDFRFDNQVVLRR